MALHLTCLYSLVISVLYDTALDVSLHFRTCMALHFTCLYSLVISVLYGTALDMHVESRH